MTDRSLVADFTTRAGAFELALAIDVRPDRTLALVGPNGAGKTTAISGIAGIRPLDSGRISIAGRVLDDTTAGISVPIERRRVGLVFQDYVLFPHLSVLENIAFGPRSAGVPAAHARETAREWLGRLDLDGFESRRPHELSGGQAQRVALARALAAEPDVLLLDEPLAALDVEIRRDVRAELAEHLAAFSGVTIVVTHGLDDIAALADDVVVLERGTVTQRGTLAELRDAPATPYVERLVDTTG